MPGANFPIPDDFSGATFTDKVKAALASPLVSRLLIPRKTTAPYYHEINDTIIIPPGKGIIGEGFVNPLKLNLGDPATLSGTLIVASTWAGTDVVWTDINPTVNDAPFRPAFVAGGPGAYMRDISIYVASPNIWHAGFFVPAVRRVKLWNVNISGSWADAGLYLDATWSSVNNATWRNGERVAPLPRSSIEEDDGVCEFESISCYFGGLRGFKLRGTDRDPAVYNTSVPLTGSPVSGTKYWVWAPAGTSDIRFIDCEFRNDGANAQGASIWLDAAILNAAQAGQGIWMFGATLRSRSAQYMLYADRINRVYIQGYGEAATDLDPGYGRVQVFSRTGSIEFAGRFIRANLYLDGTDKGSFDSGNRGVGSVILNHYQGRRYVGEMIYGLDGPSPQTNNVGAVGTTLENFANVYSRSVASNDKLTLERASGTSLDITEAGVLNWTIGAAGLAPSTAATHVIGTSTRNLANVRTAQVQADVGGLKLRGDTEITFAAVNATARWMINGLTFSPTSDVDYDIGTATNRVRAFYVRAIYGTELSTYANEAAAAAAGLTSGRFYKSADGIVRVKL